MYQLNQQDTYSIFDKLTLDIVILISVSIIKQAALNKPSLLLIIILQTLQLN